MLRTVSSANSEVEALCLEHGSPAIEMIIRARSRDLGGFTVRRTLPSPRRRLVGPFVFFDHMGPVSFPPGQGIDVRPHPHIGLATVTYLFEGELFHRDTLGSAQSIRPGDVNWMVAGRGIAHSERTSAEPRRAGQSYHGIQAWVALPREHEEGAPSFSHHPQATLPSIRREGANLRVIAGEAYGVRSPVTMTWSTLYVDAILDAGATLEELELPELDRSNWSTINTILASEAALIFGDLVARDPDRTSNHLKDLVRTGKVHTAYDYLAAKALQEELRSAVSSQLSGFDAVLTLPAFGEAPEGLGYTGDAEYCAPWTLLGMPAVSLPAGFGKSGLPLGLQIVGAYRQDYRTLRVAKWIESVLKFDPGIPRVHPTEI